MRYVPGHPPRKKRPRPQDQFAYAGGDIRLLTSAPDYALPPNSLPRSPGPASPAPPPPQASVPPERTVETLAAGQPGAPQTHERKEPAPSQAHETHMAHNLTPNEDQSPSHLSIEVEYFDHHTQREIYSAMALPPEKGLGPKSVVTPSLSPKPQSAQPSPKKLSNSVPASAIAERDLSLIRHEARCAICNHPERDAIEQAILHWQSPTRIAYEFDLDNRLPVYRHGHALGLFEQRASKTRHVLAQVMEQAGSVVPTADAVVRAVRAFTCLDDKGRWHEPRKEVVITHRVIAGGPIPSDAVSVSPLPPNLVPLPPRNLIDTHDEQKVDSNHTESTT